MTPRIPAGSIVGYVVLAGITVTLFTFNLIGTALHVPGLAVVSALVLAGLLFEGGREWRTVGLPKQHVLTLELNDLGSFLSVVAGTMVTWLLSVDMGLGAVVASGLVGLVGALVVKRHAAAVFCGSFVGMSSPALFASPVSVAIAGLIAGAVFVLGKSVFGGFGGKLGTTAFLGCLATSLVQRCPLQVAATPTGALVWWIVAYTTAGAVLTWIVSIRLGHGPVVASAAVGLVAGLVLPVIHGPADGGLIAAAVFAASFAGMSSEARMGGGTVAGLPVGGEAKMAAAGVLCGLVFVYTAPYLGGAGGKLGTIAFGSVIALRGLLGLAGVVRSGFARVGSVGHG